MIAAKEPPTPEIVAEALVLLDQLVLDNASGAVLDVLIARRKDRHPIVEIYDRVMAEAVPQYLRVYPASRYNALSRYLTLEAVEDRERHYICLFCRENLGTLGRAIYIQQRDRATAPTLLRAAAHADLCAARFLAGQIRGHGPRQNERVQGVATLIGKRLINEAKAAATYLGRDPIPAKFRKQAPDFVTQGRATPLRKLITEARKAAAEVAQKAATEPAWRAA